MQEMNFRIDTLIPYSRTALGDKAKPRAAKPMKLMQSFCVPPQQKTPVCRLRTKTNDCRGKMDSTQEDHDTFSGQVEITRVRRSRNQITNACSDPKPQPEN